MRSLLQQFSNARLSISTYAREVFAYMRRLFSVNNRPALLPVRYAWQRRDPRDLPRNLRRN